MNRKASDIILELEQKVDKAISLLENNELMFKILSNKLSLLLKDDKKSLEKEKVTSPIFAEAADVKETSKYNITKPETIHIDSDNINIDAHPHGHRRVSRHEAYTGKNSFSTNKLIKNDNFDSPIQVPQGKGVRVVNPQIVDHDDDFKEYSKDNVDDISIPVVQRVLYPDGKAVFMAEVNIISLPDLNNVEKVRTSGIGKWSATLKSGKYRALIKARDRITKQSSEKTFDFIVDGSSNPLELESIIINKKS